MGNLENKKFLKSNWQMIYESKHFTFFTRKRGEIKNIKDSAIKCENHFLKVCRKFQFPTNWKNKINIYVAPNQKFIQKLTGHKTVGCVVSKYSLISIYPFHPHEITHIIFSNCLGDSHYVLKEGVAVLYGWFTRTSLWKGKSLRFWVKQFKKEKTTCTFKNLIISFVKIPQSISYPLSGAIVKFLINEFGIEKFKDLYREINSGMSYKTIQEIFQKITGISLGEAEERFWKNF